MAIRQTAQQALASAVKELMEDRPIDDISVKEILARAGVSRGTFYKHYPDKQGLAQDIFEKEIVAVDWHDPKLGHRDRSVAAYRHIKDNLAFYRNAVKSREFLDMWFSQALQTNLRMIENVAAEAPVSPEVRSHFARFITHAWFQETLLWIADPDQGSPEEYNDRLCAFSDYGLGALFSPGPSSRFATGRLNA